MAAFFALHNQIIKLKIYRILKMANNSPKDLDLSACTVSLDGTNTSKKLSDWAKTLNDTASQIANISKTATDAKQSVDQVVGNTKGMDVNAYFNKNNAFTAMNPTILDNNKGNVFGVQNDNIVNLYCTHKLDANGYATPATVSAVYYSYVLNDTIYGKEAVWTWDNKFYKSFGGAAFHADSDGGSDLGINDHAWNNIYSKTAVSVTSDINEKKVVGVLSDAKNADNKKLLDAIYSLDINIYKLKDSISKKGEDKARLHNGFIAQDVEKALVNAGLDPSEYGMWIKDKIFRNENVDTGKKDKKGNPILRNETVDLKDESGNPIYRQSLRYEEILCLYIQALKQKNIEQEKKIDDLASRLSKLEGK